MQAFVIPEGFPELLQDMTREILRNQPKSEREIYVFGEFYSYII